MRGKEGRAASWKRRTREPRHTGIATCLASSYPLCTDLPQFRMRLLSIGRRTACCLHALFVLKALESFTPHAACLDRVLVCQSSVLQKEGERDMVGMERNVWATLVVAMVLICCRANDAAHDNGRDVRVRLGREKVTHLEFYMHDIVEGRKCTAIKVAPQGKPTNFSDAAGSLFGSVYVLDDPLTEGPDPKSKLVGKAQGLYAMTSSEGEFSLLMTLTYAIHSGKFKGSSLSVVGKNMVFREQREMPVVGGSGQFRLARGYAIAHTHSSQGPNAVIGYNLTVLHY